MARRPNIVLVTSDQHRGDSFGFEKPEIRTPHLDGLAADGTRFAACITPNVVCQPARASLLTGQLPLTHGVRDNGIDLPTATGERGFAAALARAGYRTGFVGKAHFSTSHTFAPTGTPECRSSMASYPPTWYGPYMGFEHVELVVEGHNVWPPMKPPAGQHYEHWYYADGRGDEKNRLYQAHAIEGTGAVQTWHSALPVAWHNSTWIGNQAIRYIERHRDEPFFLWASFPDPHHPFDAPLPWSRLHAPDDLSLPAHRTTDFDRRPWWHAASMASNQDPRYEKIRGGFLRYPRQSDAQLREIIANYYGMIALIDHNVGRILAALNEHDLARDTYIVFTSDHGEWLGDHGLLFKGPMHYEGLLRIALVVRGPDVVAGRVERSPVSLIDLAPTFEAWTGADAMLLHDGRSLAPMLRGTGEAREYAYNEWDVGAGRCGVPLRLRTVRTERYKLTVELDSGAGELYDLAVDPDEMDNRFDDPGIAGIARELRAMIDARPTDGLAPCYEPSGMA